MIDHLELESSLIHNESEEAVSQGQVSASIIDAPAEKASATSQRSNLKQKVAVEEEEEDEAEEKISQPVTNRKDSAASDESESGEQRKNQFSFVERATQTKIAATKV